MLILLAAAASYVTFFYILKTRGELRTNALTTSVTQLQLPRLPETEFHYFIIDNAEIRQLAGKAAAKPRQSRSKKPRQSYSFIMFIMFYPL